jgi:hypothetical protein
MTASTMSPQFKLFLYKCYQLEHAKNPDVRIQDIYNMVAEKYPPAAARAPAASQSPAPEPRQSSNSGSFALLPAKPVQSCDISLELMANHRKLRKPAPRE